MKRIIVVLLSLTFVVAATAQNRRPGGPGLFAPRENPLVEYLSLTPAQQAAWETSQSELHAAMRAVHDQERALAEQLREAADASTIGTLVLQMRGLAAQRDAAKDAADAKFAALLSAEQHVKFAAFEAAAEFLRQRGPGGPPRDR
ncbi:MAG TPA: Spy/CpxP family protein refolding chaperone [Thermoanaerobaculia bacterium]|nr:Spy/CpxP family protein refolding chaperone [Thermoanaerobaculia bacterium]